MNSLKLMETCEVVSRMDACWVGVRPWAWVSVLGVDVSSV